jgi:hypothetical protein
MPIPGLYMCTNCILSKLDWQCIFPVSTHSTLMKSTRSINPYKIDAMRCQSKTTRLAYPIILLSLQKPHFLFSSILIMAAAPHCHGYQFKAVEISDFLALVEEHMPVSAQLWQLVADLHAERYDKEQHTAESLGCKFQEVCRRTGPTGDPNCPDYVIYAKRLNRQLIQMVDASSGGSKAERSSEELLSGVSSEGDGKDDDGKVVKGTELFNATGNYYNGDIAGGTMGGDDAGSIAGETMGGGKAEGGIASEMVDGVVANTGTTTESMTMGGGGIRGGASAMAGGRFLWLAATRGGRGGGGRGGHSSGIRNAALDPAVAFPANHNKVDLFPLRAGQGGSHALSQSDRGRAFCTPSAKVGRGIWMVMLTMKRRVGGHSQTLWE